MQLIGKGSFTKVYKLSDKKVLVKSICYAKECLSDLGKVNYFPQYKRIGDREYTCEYYPKVTSLKTSLQPKYYEIYKDLVNVFASIKYDGKDYNNYFAVSEAFQNIKNKSVKNILLEVLEDMSNYGSDVKFEISPRNVAVKNGKLILLDVFFFASQLRDVRKNGLNLTNNNETI